jgi:capsular exopolysaccharide synthesis family protein
METVDLEQALRNVSDILLGDMELEAIRKTPGMEYIWILPSGHPPANPAEILESAKITSLITELKRRFDVILFDSPPILPITDASLLAPRTDSVVLVYEIGKTARSALLRAKVQLETMNAKIAGVILNHIRPQTEGLPAYPYYYYKYKYYGTKAPHQHRTGEERNSEAAG